MRGLWDNIHAKRKRIKSGSGEKMRKPGSKGSPTNKALIKSKRKRVKRYKEGGKPDIFSKPNVDTSSSVDTNVGPDMLDRKDLANQHKFNKQKKFDKQMASNQGGSIDKPAYLRNAQDAARLNPLSSLIAGPADAIQRNREKNNEASMKEGGVVFNKPKRTPDHPKKSHVVIVRSPGGGKKTIRFGEQGASTAGKPKEGESDKMKAKRKSFKSRHGKNIARGPQSAAYWADKVKWENGGVNKDRKFFIGGLMSKIASITPLGMGIKALKERRKSKGGNSGDGSPDGAHVHSHQEGGNSEGAAIEAKEAVEGGVKEEKTPDGVMEKGGIAPEKDKTMEDDFLFAAGVIKGDKEAQRKVKKQLYANEEATYRSINRKPPKRNIFRNGGVLAKKKKK